MYIPSGIVTGLVAAASVYYHYGQTAAGARYWAVIVIMAVFFAVSVCCGIAGRAWFSSAIHWMDRNGQWQLRN